MNLSKVLEDYIEKRLEGDTLERLIKEDLDNLARTFPSLIRKMLGYFDEALRDLDEDSRELRRKYFRLEIPRAVRYVVNKVIALKEAAFSFESMPEELREELNSYKKAYLSFLQKTF